MARKGVADLSSIHSTIQVVAPGQTVPKAWKYKLTSEKKIQYQIICKQKITLERVFLGGEFFC